MIRKMLTATTVIAALLLSVLSFGGLTADAGPRAATSRPSTQSAPTPKLTLARSPTCLHLLLGLTVWAHLTQLLVRPLQLLLPVTGLLVWLKPVAKALSSHTPVPASSPSAL